MSTDQICATQVQLERRAGQRFDFQLPVSVRKPGSGCEACGFTQNLSARGALFYTDFPLCEADEIELTLVMPGEITLAENMRVRCRGKVLRVLPSGVGTKSIVAVHLADYEFLPETSEDTSASDRILALHPHTREDEARWPTNESF